MKHKFGRLFSFFLCLLGINISVWCRCVTSDSPEIRLDKNDGPMSHVPVTNQGGLEICYAHVASQMVDAYRFSHGDTDYNHHTSELHAALLSAMHEYKENGKTSLDIGYLHKTINLLFSNGSCDKAVLERILKEVERSNKSYKQSRQVFKSLLDVLNSSNPSCSQAVIESQVVSKTTTATEDIMVKLSGENYLRRLNLAVQEACKGHMKTLPRPGFESYDKNFGNIRIENAAKLSQHEKARAKIAINDKVRDLFCRLLVENKQPIGIVYCQNIFSNKNFSLRPTELAKRDDTRCSAGWHISTIIGKRYNQVKKRYEFLVRNTRGKKCGTYPKDWSCEDGNNWIPEDVIYNNTNEAYWLVSPIF